MHPALSIIFFTTVSGLGYGLGAVLGLGLLDPASIATGLAHVLALALISVGLLSSTLHLGNPQRAWRAFSQWRSSWLSREGVMAVLTFLPLAGAAAASIFAGRYLAWLGLAGMLMSLVTVYCTAMIYASLKSVESWHTQLTPLCYVLFALAGGFCAATFFAAAGDGPVAVTAALSVVFLILAWTAKLVWRNRMNTIRPMSTPETATGLGAIGSVRLLERPHVNDNYLTREMGFKVARKHASKLAVIALALGGAAPALLLLVVALGGFDSGLPTAMAAGTAVLLHAIGMLVERWLFFAEARHAVMNYYGG